MHKWFTALIDGELHTVNRLPADPLAKFAVQLGIMSREDAEELCKAHNREVDLDELRKVRRQCVDAIARVADFPLVVARLHEAIAATDACLKE